MVMNENDIDKTIDLTCSRPTPEWKIHLLARLNDILELLDIIGKIDIKNLAGMTHISPLSDTISK